PTAAKAALDQLPAFAPHAPLYRLPVPHITVGLQQRGQGQQPRFDRRFAPRLRAIALGQSRLKGGVEKLMAYGAQKDKELPRFLGALGNFLFFRAQLDRRIPHDRLLTGEGSHLSSPYQIIDTPILSTLYDPLSKCSVSELMLRLCCLLQTVELGICESPLTGLKLGQQCGQFGTVKLPLKRRRVLIGKLFI